MTHDDWEASSRSLLAPLREPMAVPSTRVRDLEASVHRAEVERVAEMIAALPAERDLRRRRRQLGAWSGAIAAAGLLAVGLAQLLPSGPSADASAEAETGRATLMAGHLTTRSGQVLQNGATFDELGQLATPEGQSALVLTEAGAQVTFAPSTRASLSRVADVHRVDLIRGQVRLDVPPLPAGASLVVSTEDALVTVVGTRFSVSHAGGDDPTTCVRVSEGRVSVRRNDGNTELLGPGASSGCADDAENPTPEAALDTPEPERNADTRTRRPVRSTLGHQNQLMREGLAAEQSGDYERARRQLRALVNRYPSSPHVTEAKRALSRVERSLAAAP